MSTFTDIYNKISGVNETVWISAGIVNKSDFSKFLSAVDNKFDDRDQILNVSDFHAYQECKCYCTPQEVCLAFK